MATNFNGSNHNGKYTNADKQRTNATKAAKPFPASADPMTTSEKLKKLGLGICVALAVLAVVLVFFTLLFQPEWLIKALTYLGLAFLGTFLVLIIHRIGFIHGRDETKEREKRKRLEALEKLEDEHKHELELLEAKHHQKELAEVYQLGFEASSAENRKMVREQKMTSHLARQLEEELLSEQQANEALRARNTQLEHENEQLLQTNAELVKALPEEAPAESA